MAPTHKPREWDESNTERAHPLVVRSVSVGMWLSALFATGEWRARYRMAISADDDANFSTDELDRDQCMDLLGQARIGRVVLSVNCIPVAVPVNVSLLDEAIVFWTDAGAKLNAALGGQVVSVEVDDVDAMYHTGWSVLVTGIAELVDDPSDRDRARARLLPWAPGSHPFLIRVPSTLISGRVIAWGGLQDAGYRE